MGWLEFTGATYRVKQRVNALLERLLLRLKTEKVVPCHGISEDEAAEDVVRADHTHHAEGEEGDGNAVEDKRLVVDKAGDL